MNERTVIRFERRHAAADEFQCKLVSPQQPKIASVPSPFDVTALTGPFPGDPVQDLGSRIFKELCKNDAIKGAITDVLKAKKNTIRPIYIDTETVRAESICWEALWEETFLALDRRWPIARRAQSDASSPKTFDRFSPPLRILAVISAENYRGEPEWEGLCDAAQRTTDGGFQVQVKVVTGEEELMEKLRAAAKPGTSTVKPEAVPKEPSALDLLIAQFKPHVVHFFCHGVIEQDPWLVIRRGGKGQSLDVAVDELPALQAVWLVVLNSCDSSVPAGDVPSMAYQLVATMGVPFVVGTLAPVEVHDAYKFSEAFYKRLLYEFSEVFKATAPKAPMTIGWTEALHAARDAIDRKYRQMSAQNNQWTLPVLYERNDKLLILKDEDPPPAPVAKDAPTPIPVVERPKTDPMVIRATMVADLLRHLPPDTPEADKRALVASILDRKEDA